MSNLNVNESNSFKMNYFSPIHNFEFKEKIIYKPTINYPTKSTRENTDKKIIINSNENTIEKYWEKRAKENLEKMQKIKNEQDYREYGELKNKPTISQESIYIAKKLSEDSKKNDSIDRNKDKNENAAEYYNKKNMENLRKIEKYGLIKKFKEQMLKEVENYNQKILLSEQNQYKNNFQNNNKNINFENSNNNYNNNNQNYLKKAGTNYSTYPFFSNKQMIYTMNTNPIKLTDRNDICFRSTSSKNKKKIKKIEKQEENKIGNDGEINVEEAVKKNELNIEDIKPMEINETDFKKFFGENGNLDNYNIDNNPKLKNTKTVTFLEPMNTAFAQSKSNALLLSRKASKKTFLSKYDLKTELDLKEGNSITKMISNVSSINDLNIQSKFNSNSSSKKSFKQLEKKQSKIQSKPQSKENSHVPSRQISSTQSFKSSKSNINKSKLESNNLGIMYKSNDNNKSKINESIHSNKSKVNKSKISKKNTNKEDSSHSNNINNNKSNESIQSNTNQSKINDSKNSNIRNSKSSLSNHSIIQSVKNEESSSSNLNSSEIKKRNSIESKKNTINESIESNKKDFIKIEESSPVKSKLNESFHSNKNKSKIEEDNVVVLKTDISKKTINKSNSNNNSNVKKIIKKSSLRSNKNSKSLKVDLETNKKLSKKLSFKNSHNSLREIENENYVELNPMDSLKKNKNNYTEYNNNEINNDDNRFADIVISKIQDNQEKNIQMKNDMFEKFDLTNKDLNQNDPWINFREENNKRLQDLNNFKNDFIEIEPDKLTDEAKKIISKSMKLKVTNNFINGEYTSYDNKIDYLNQKLDINNEKKKNLLSQF